MTRDTSCVISPTGRRGWGKHHTQARGTAQRIQLTEINLSGDPRHGSRALSPDRGSEYHPRPLNRSDGSHAWPRALAIASAALVAYLPALRGGFVFDDHMLLLEGQALNLGSLSDIWLTTKAPDFFPLTWTTFWIEWRLFGPNPLPYHLANLLLHCAAAVLLWRVLARLRIPGAWLGGLLFAVHPVAVESVAWISERKNTLSAVFFLAAALAWLAADDERARAVASRHRLAAFGLFVLALLAKPTVVMLPVVLVAVDALRDGRLERRHVVRALPLFAAALAAGLVAIWFQHENALAGQSLGRGMGERVGGAAWALLAYVQKAFVPVRLGFVYAHWPVSTDSLLFYLPLVVVAIAAGTLWLAFRRGRARPVALALAYHAAIVLPVLGLIDMAYLRVGPISNHLQYLALMGPAALGGYGLARLEQAASPTVARAAAAALVILLGASTFERSRAFASDLALWDRTVQDSPASAFARKEHAKTLLGAGRAAEAIQEFRVYAALTRDEADGHRALAVAALLEQRWPEAVEQATRAHALSPDATFQRDFARQLMRSGRPAEAQQVLRQPLR